MAPTLTFFDLPAEIRNEIYIHHLVTDESIELPYAYESKPILEPALLSAHSSIRQEAAPIYYGCNTFEAPSPASAHYFLNRLSPEHVSWIMSFRAYLPVTAVEAIRKNMDKILGTGLSPEAIEVPLRSEHGGPAWGRWWLDMKKRE